LLEVGPTEKPKLLQEWKKNQKLNTTKGKQKTQRGGQTKCSKKLPLLLVASGAHPPPTKSHKGGHKKNHKRKQTTKHTKKNTQKARGYTIPNPQPNHQTKKLEV